MKNKPFSSPALRILGLTFIAVAIIAAVIVVINFPELMPKFTQEDKGTGTSDAVATEDSQVLGKQSADERPTVKEVTEVQDIPFETQTITDPSLATGQTTVRKEGAPGSEKILYKVTYAQGKAVDKQVVSKQVTRKPTPKIVVNGTKPLPGNSRFNRPAPAPKPTPPPSVQNVTPTPPPPAAPNIRDHLPGQSQPPEDKNGEAESQIPPGQGGEDNTGEQGGEGGQGGQGGEPGCGLPDGGLVYIQTAELPVVCP